VSIQKDSGLRQGVVNSVDAGSFARPHPSPISPAPTTSSHAKQGAVPTVFTARITLCYD